MPDDALGRITEPVPLFSPPGQAMARALEEYRAVLEAAYPLKAKHAAQLPADVKRLSLALTEERGPGPHANYLASAPNLSAYLWYFLPWNLCRLSRLLAGSAFDLPDGASILDVGSGPLTLAQALWLARPGLRARRLRFVCLDQTGQVLRAGKALFNALASGQGSAWELETLQVPAHKAPQEAFALVAALNAANELIRGRGQEGRDSLERMAFALAQRMAPDGRLLMVEPGTRLGGGLLARVRAALLEEGLTTLAPCTHDEACPMLAARWRSWCHFSFPAKDAPSWLARLTKLAGLEKDHLSLSFLLMAPGRYGAGQTDGRLSAAGDKTDCVRVVSHRFPVPGGQGVYVCGEQGLRLLTFKRAPHGLFSGALVRAQLPAPVERDPKSGVWLTALACGGSAGQARSAPQAGIEAPHGRGLRAGQDACGAKRPRASRQEGAGGGPRKKRGGQK